MMYALVWFHFVRTDHLQYYLLDTYIDNVDTDLDKDRIKGEMQGLMNEAQAMDIT